MLLRKEEGSEAHGEAWRAVEDLNAWAGGFDGRAADLRYVRVVLTFSASASAMPPSGPRLLLKTLHKRRRWVKSVNAASVHAMGP